MVDVRDTFFQSDPFAMLPVEKSQFYVFKGVESKTIMNCGWNGGWVCITCILCFFGNLYYSAFVS